MFAGIKPDKPIALFDVDGVLVQGFTIEHFAEYLVQQRLFPEQHLNAMRDDMTRYLAELIDYDELARNWIDYYAKGIAGNDVETIKQLATSFWKEKADKLLYPYAIQLIELLKAHCTIIAISGSTKESLYPLLCETLKMDFFYATEIASNNGRYVETKPLNRAIDGGKKEVVEQCVNILPKNVLALSFGFGDNPLHDKSLLEHVASPYLFARTTSKAKVKFQSELAELEREVPLQSVLWHPDDNSTVILKVQNRLSELALLRHNL